MGVKLNPTVVSDQEAMDAFFATHRYDVEGDWRKTPETEEDPDGDEDAEGETVETEQGSS